MASVKNVLFVSTILLFATTATAQEVPERNFEVGVSTADLYLSDLVINSKEWVAYLSYDYNSLPFGIESTGTIAFGKEEHVDYASFLLFRTFGDGPLTFEASGGLFYFWNTEQTISLLGGTLEYAFTDRFSVGVLHSIYDIDFVDSTTSAFLDADFGFADLNLGYSWIDSGNEGVYAEIGRTWETGATENRVALKWIEGGPVAGSLSFRF